MRVLFLRDKQGVQVIRDPNAPKIYTETAFFHALKLELNARHNMDLVKRLMYKDGHMVDDHQYYLRDRKWGFCIYDGAHAVRMVYEPYNQGFVVLNYVNLKTDNHLVAHSRREKAPCTTAT